MKKGGLRMRKTIVGVFILSLASGLSAQTNGVQTATVALSTAQLQSLREGPVILIPAPGPGQAINVASATLQYNAGTERYSGGHSRFEITLGSYDSLTPICVFDSVLTSGFTDQDGDQTQTLQANPLDPSLDIQNLDLEIVNFGPPLIDGNGTVTITVNYALVAQH